MTAATILLLQFQRLFRSGFDLLRREGVVAFAREAIGYVHRLVRNGLPVLYGRHLAMLPLVPRPTYNGVTVRTAHLPWEDPDRPTYESGLMAGMRNHVDAGEDVVIVGGGYGVTAVEAANRVGSEGSVVVFEGSPTWAERAEQTVRLNGVESVVDVRQAVVGPNVNVYDDADTAGSERLSVDSLPECDVLELDCEGAELEILRELVHRPSKLFVETHGMHGAPSSRVRELLEEMSYDVVSTTVADESSREFCEKNDVLVLVAERDDAESVSAG